MAAGRHSGIKTVPVAGQHADVVGADKFVQFFAVAAGHDLEGRAGGRDHDPQPSSFAHRRLVDVGGGLSGGRQDLVGDRLQHPARVSLDRTDLPGRERHAEQIAHQVRGVFFAQSILAGE